MQSTPRIPIPMPEIEAFCKKWKITDLSLFGSVLRDDFGPDSDVDVLVHIDRSVRLSYDNLLTMEGELRRLFGRKVDLVTRASVEESTNPLRRRAILNAAQKVY